MPFNLREFFSIFLIILATTGRSSQSNDDEILAAGLDPRIVGGYLAQSGMAKYQVSIRVEAYDRVFGVGHICGGTLIRPDLVLTAAHCMYDQQTKRLRRASEFKLVMGTHNVLQRNADTIIRKVVRMVIHKGYDAEIFANDIAILKVGRSLKHFWPYQNYLISFIDL